MAAANIVFNSVRLTAPAVWTALAASSTIVNATIIVEGFGLAPSEPAINVRYKSTGSTYLWPIDTKIELQRVDLADIEVAYSNMTARVFVAGATF